MITLKKIVNKKDLLNMITFKKIVFAKLVRVVHGWAEVGVEAQQQRSNIEEDLILLLVG